MKPDERDAMLRRFEEARDEARSQAIQPDGTAVTTVFCDWFGLPCGGCGHTFREGDRVSVDRDPRGGPSAVRHLDPLLGCAGGAIAEIKVGEMTTRFHAAVDKAVPPPRNLSVDRLRPGDSLLRFHEDRSNCYHCSYTFRPYEVVVRCPCGELGCDIALHRDPQRGLLCFDETWPDLKVTYCPFKKRATGR